MRKEKILEMIKDVIFLILTPPLTIGGATWGIVRLFDFYSLPFFLWISFIVWLIINYVKKGE